MNGDQFVITATYIAPTERGTEYQETYIVGEGTTISEALQYPESKAGSAILAKVEISKALEFK